MEQLKVDLKRKRKEIKLRSDGTFN